MQTGKKIKRTLLLLGPLPPPIGGHTLAFSELMNYLMRTKEFSIKLVNISVSKVRRGSSFSMGRAIELVSRMCNVFLKLMRSDLVYLTIAQSVWGFLRDIPVIWAAWFLKKKIVLHLHGGNFDGFYNSRGPFYRGIISLTVSRADVFIVLSHTFRKRMAVVKGLEGRLVVVPNGVTAPPQAKVKRLTPGEEMQVLYLSNLIIEKGYLDLVEAARVLQVSFPDVRARIHFAGEFHLDRDSYVSPEEMSRDFFLRLEQANIRHMVTYHGPVHGDQKKRLLELSHVFVLPTYYRYEGQPISVLEAMAYGIPVVATDHAAIADMIEDETNGYLIFSHSGELIADRLSRLYRSPHLIEMMSQRGAERVRELFSFESHAKAIVNIFRSCLVDDSRVASPIDIATDRSGMIKD